MDIFNFFTTGALAVLVVMSFFVRRGPGALDEYPEVGDDRML